MDTKRNLFIILSIFLVAFLLRFYQLGNIPNGLYQDESAIGYNAYSILETGKDEHGKSFPLYFKSFGDQKLPVYIYTDTIAIKLFGLTPFAVRFPSALFGFLTVVVLYFFVRDLTKNNKLAITSSLLLAINPWHLHYNRATYEVSLSLFFFVLGSYLINKFFQKNAHGGLLFGTLCFIVSLYSYNLTRLMAPLLFLVVVVYNKKYIKKINKKEAVLTAIINSFALIPFVLTFFQKGGISSASGTLIFSSAVVQAPLLELRAYMLALPFGVDKLFFNKYILTLWQYLINIASYFSVDFFFLKGSAHGNHGIGNMGLFYLFELPLIVLGIYHFLRSKMIGATFLISWGIITILIASLTRDVPHATRSFFLLLPMVVFSGAGAINVYGYIKSLKSKNLRYAMFLAGIVFIFFNVFYYLSSYYVRFPILYAKPWRFHDRELSLYIAKNETKYEKIIIDKDAGFMYTSLLFYNKYPPSEFQKSVSRFPDDEEGFSKVVSFGKYEFRKIDWGEDIKLSKTLLISSPEKKPENISAHERIDFSQRPVYFAKDQRIISYPITETAYVLVETK